MSINYEKILRENLSESAFKIITSNEKEFAYWIEKIKKDTKKSERMFRELKAYKDKEEQGLLRNIPVAIGAKVYILDYRELRKGEVYNAVLYKNDWMRLEGFTYDVPARGFIFSPSDIGKTIFLTEAEAEEALARMKGE